MVSGADATTTFTTSVSPGILKATQTTEQVITTDAGTIRCSTANQEGNFSSTAFSELEMSAAYSGCKAFGFLSATVSMGGCKYRYVGSLSGRKATWSIVCSTGDITVTTFGCVIHFKAQAGLEHVVFSNGAGIVHASFLIAGLRYSQTEGCPNGSGEKTNGTLNGGADFAPSSGTVQVDE
jgi:hypothetical protein